MTTPDPDGPSSAEVEPRPTAWERAARGTGRFLLWTTRPIRRMWGSEAPLEAYALVHFAHVAGDTLLAIALANTIFFELPVGEARTQVALYLALTMAPLAVAAPVLVPLLDRSPFRRVISFGATAGRSVMVLFAAGWVDQPLLLFPATFVVLVFSKIHLIAKNGLTASYAPTGEALMRANAFLARVAIAGFAVAAPPGAALLSLTSSRTVLYVAAAVYATGALLNLRLAPASRPPEDESRTVDRRGRLPHLAVAAVGNGGLRAAQGFLIALLSFALRDAGKPAYWFVILLVGATVGAAIGDVFAPRVSERVREEMVVIGSLVAAGVAAVIAFQTFALATLAIFTFLAGMATEFGRLGFQSLMQENAPGSAQGRVFVRYEVVFQLAWVAGAFLPSMFPIPFRWGILTVAVFYLGLGVPHLIGLLRVRARPGWRGTASSARAVGRGQGRDDAAEEGRRKGGRDDRQQDDRAL